MTGRKDGGADGDEGLGPDPANDEFFEDGSEGRGRVEWRDGPVLPGSRSDREREREEFETYDNDEPEQLSLGTSDDDVRLPWLESADDDYEDASGSGQTIGLIALGLLALALIVGAIWWLTRRGTDDTPVADGSVIEAPDGPYKERPKDPGGKTFDGTGDTSFAVSEGQTRPAQLGQSGAAPAPGFASVPKAGASVAPAQAASAAKGAVAGTPAPVVDSSGVGVQVGAFSTRAAAEAGWSKLSDRHSALKGLRHRVVEGKADIGTVYRVQAVAADAGAARVLCAGLQREGLACQVK
jgi:SPOR domain